MGPRGSASPYGGGYAQPWSWSSPTPGRGGGTGPAYGVGAPATVRPAASSSGASTVLAVLGALVGLALLVAAVVGVVHWLRGRDASGGPTPSSSTTRLATTVSAPVPTRTPTAAPSGTLAPTRAPSTTARPTAAPPGGPASTYSPTVRPTRPPQPDRRDIDKVLQENPLYGTAVTPVSCRLPSVELESLSDDQMQVYLDDLVSCLMAAWGPEMDALGYSLSHPSVILYRGTIMTPCRKSPDPGKVWAWYCSADMQIYYPLDNGTRGWGSTRYLGPDVIAHEFGHHVQHESGILAADSVRISEAGSAADELRWIRRVELQANCFAGLFMQAVVAPDPLTAKEKQATVDFEGGAADSPDHGSAAHMASWLRAGFEANGHVFACNTFTTSDSEVA